MRTRFFCKSAEPRWGDLLRRSPSMPALQAWNRISKYENDFTTASAFAKATADRSRLRKATLGQGRPTLALQLLAMTCFLVITTTPAAACPIWVAQWRNHSGTLPNSSRLPATVGNIREWSVTANFGGGNRTLHGQAWCVATGTPVPPTAHNPAGNICWCRMTTAGGDQETWQRPFSSARGSGTETCTGTTPGTACFGSWVFSFGLAQGNTIGCSINCAYDCAWCVQHGSSNWCTRTELLQ